MLGSLSHENIVTIFQVGEANGVPYLEMERLEGMTLHEKLKQDRWLPLAEALSLARQSAEGLAVLHQHGLVHRDFKPANLWLEYRQGQFRRIKLIDFGIARRVAESSTLTQPGQVLGTVVYMAPEQASGQPVDGRADLYSLGCVLFQMLTGETPLGGRNSATRSLLREIVRGQSTVVRDRAPQLPGPVAGLIQELLAHNPASRPASAAVLAERLRRVEQDARLETVPTTPAHVPPEVRRTGRQPGFLGIWLGGLTVLLALVVGLVAGWNKLFTPAPDEDNNPTQQDGAKAQTGPPIKVGILHSLSGSLAGRERPIVHALHLAIEEINAAGRLLGRTIEWKEEDGASDPEVFARQARKLLEQEKVEVLFGCWTSASRRLVYPICQQQDRLLFYSAASEGLEASPNVIYLGGTPNQTAIPLIKWVRKKLGKQRFYLVGTQDVYSRRPARDPQARDLRTARDAGRRKLRAHRGNQL